jgi:hypothetical protein
MQNVITAVGYSMDIPQKSKKIKLPNVPTIPLLDMC